MLFLVFVLFLPVHDAPVPSHPFCFCFVCCRYLITVLAGSGIISAVYANLSCRWFLWNPSMADAWDFLPKTTTTIDNENVHGVTIGLFRYRPTMEEQQQHDSGVICLPYTRFFVGSDYPWLSTAQVFTLLGPILACLGLASVWMKRYHNNEKNNNNENNNNSNTVSSSSSYGVAGGFLLFATGSQAAGTVASTSWCGGRFWDCPWLVGAHANVLAAIFFQAAWMVAICGCCFRAAAAASSSAHHDNNSSNHPKDNENSLAEGTNSTENNLPFDEIELGPPPFSPPKPPQALTAEELLGTNDPIIFRAVSQGVRVIRDLPNSFLPKQKQQQPLSPSLDLCCLDDEEPTMTSRGIC